MRSKKLVQRGIAFISAMSIAVASFAIQVSAWGRGATKVSAEEAKSAAKEDWRTYTQTDPRWGAIYIGSQNCHDFGCQATTEAALMKATGLMPEDWSPYDYMMYLNSIGSPAGIQGYPLNPFDEVKQYVAYDETLCKEALDNGCYVELRMGGATNGSWGGYDGLAGTNFHSVYVTGYDSGGVLFGETWDGGDRWASGISNGLGRKYEKLYVNKTCTSFNGDGFTATMNPGGMRIMVCRASAFNNEAALAGKQGGGNFSGDSSDSGKSDVTPMTSEGYKWVEEQGFLECVKPCLYEVPVGSKLPSFEGLDMDDKGVVRDWRDDIDRKNEPRVLNFIRAGVSFIGILLTVYGLMLYVAYHFDTVNNILDIQLLGILTLGRLRASKEESGYVGGLDSQSRGARVVNHTYIIKTCFITVGFGILLISGGIYKLILWVINFIRDLVK